MFVSEQVWVEERHTSAARVSLWEAWCEHKYFPSTLVLAQNPQEQCVKPAEEMGWVSLHKHKFSTNLHVPNRDIGGDYLCEHKQTSVVSGLARGVQPPLTSEREQKKPCWFRASFYSGAESKETSLLIWKTN